MLLKAGHPRMADVLARLAFAKKVVKDLCRIGALIDADQPHAFPFPLAGALQIFSCVHTVLPDPFGIGALKVFR